MQLTKLEIKGFKSFGDKVVINFDEGITGIVGPNGCGKSNVVDAIRWVLGEQKTKALRSDKMENVIFNGTKKRKATQLAEVSLSFNNTKNLLPTEYSNLTITRKYYRSGESEYQLNGVTCRLKDITNLFLDTGIASNSYAIIELKMVDDILNDKDNARRGLFEEAAGVSKFKIRKKETLRKLEGTDADLARVDDLLFEIDKNLKSLEKQAKQAEKYFQIKEEYKEFSVELAAKTVQKQTDLLKSLQKQVSDRNDAKIALNKQLSEKEAAIEKAKADLISQEKLLASRQRTLNEFVAKIRQYESDKKVKNERLHFLQDKSTSLNEQISLDKQSSERAAFSINSLTKEKEEAEKALQNFTRNLESLKSEFEEQKLQTNSVQEKSNVATRVQREKQNEVYQLQKAHEIKAMQLSSLKLELDKTATDTSQQTENVVAFGSKLDELQSELSRMQSDLEKEKRAEENLQAQIESNQKTIEVIREELTQTNRKLDARQNEYNLTKSLVDNLEGFPEAIKFLKKNSNWGKNAPLLSDVLTCDEKYRVTIENFLEPFMNYYIVDSEAHAYEAINLLSDASKGKANFFILDRFEKFHHTAPKIFKQTISASEIVEYDSKYTKLISYILDNVYIVEDSEIRYNDADCIFISANGKITSRKFSISGGSVGLFEGKRIGRAKNLQNLESEIKGLGKKLKEISSSFDKKQLETEKLKSSSRRYVVEELHSELNIFQQEYISVKTRQEQFQDMLSNQATRKEDIQAKIEELTEEFQSIQPKLDSESLALKNHEDTIALLSEEVNNSNELLSLKSSAFNEQNIIFHQNQNRVSSFIQEISFKQNALDSSAERIERNQEELRKNESHIRQLLETSETSEDDLIGMYEEKEGLDLGVNEVEKEYYSARALIDDGDKDIRSIIREREGVDDSLMALQTELSDSKLQLSSVKERLSVEFNIDLDQLMIASEEKPKGSGLDESALREKVQRIKERIERMGPVNPMAMEAYDEIKKRHDFIVTQKDDLNKAKESLLATIEEIDAVAQKTFIEAYDKIKENFIKVFRSLFTDEDDCDLVLSDPDNPLESKIEITAKPKGKRPLTINQLSGGEKTLTAISLLFAIYLLKPAPFCIFDEVDAPLDDANIDKFNKIIRTFAKDSQFIIVTHNKRTMSSTDIIYGITMIEQGVSRVVPVDLRELA